MGKDAEEVGSGAFADVLRGKLGCEEVAVKWAIGDDTEASVLQELSLLLRMGAAEPCAHPHIVQVRPWAVCGCIQGGPHHVALRRFSLSLVRFTPVLECMQAPAKLLLASSFTVGMIRECGMHLDRASGLVGFVCKLRT